MAQVKPFTWYERESAHAFAGMKADTSVDVVDSFTVEDGINPGEPVMRGTDGAKQCKVSTSDANTIGIAVHTHKEPELSGKYYPAGYVAPIMTFGDIYVEVDSDVTAGSYATFHPSGGKITWGSGSTAHGIVFLDNGAAGDIVRVRIRM